MQFNMNFDKNQTFEITRIQIELIPENKMLKPYEHPFAYVFRGAIMRWLHEKYPKMVHQLHDFDKIRPFSINCIIDNEIPKIDFILTCYDDELEKIFLERFKEDNQKFLHLGEKKYIISNVIVEKKNLLEFIVNSNPVISFAIKFITPTCFNTSLGDYSLRFPFPSVLFGNLINIWNMLAHSSATINEVELINWVNAHIYVSYYKMHTVKRNIDESKPIYGGIGDVSYRVTQINKFYYSKNKKDEILKTTSNYLIEKNYIEKCKWIEILCRLGEFTNVGSNRTAGMGVIRYYPREYLDLNKKNLNKF